MLIVTGYMYKQTWKYAVLSNRLQTDPAEPANHRAVLGMGWSRGGNTRCRVSAISGHGKSGKKFPKAEKGLDKRDSLYIFQTVGIFVPAGSGKH